MGDDEQQQEYEQHGVDDDAGWQDEQQEYPEENEEDVENLAQVLTVAARNLQALTQGRNSLDQGVLKRGSVQVVVLPVALSATGPVTMSVPNQVWKVLTASQRERYSWHTRQAIRLHLRYPLSRPLLQDVQQSSLHSGPV